MKKFCLLSAIVIFCVINCISTNALCKVYEVPLTDEVNSTSWHYVNNGLQQAKAADADIVVLHINTYGGAVDYADSIRTALLNYPKPVYAFIDNNAASAGALISIACDSIFMRNGANIGAATVVDGISGAAMPDKYQSYMRSMMRATAESHGKTYKITPQGDTITAWLRDPLIAEAMVDPRTAVAHIGDDSTKVVTFTANEAIKYGFCEGIRESVDDVVKNLNVGEYTIQSYKPSTWDKVFGFLTNPAFQAILVMIMIAGVYYELQSPGIGFPLAASLIAALLYFAPLYMSGSAESWEILMFVAGLIAIILEVFVIPGFGVVGISGIVLIVLSLLLSAINNIHFSFESVDISDIYISMATIIGGVLLGVLLIVYLSHKIGTKKGFMSFTALQLEQKVDEGYIGVPTDISKHVGSTATAATDLRPSGKITIDGTDFDAVSLSGFIAQGSTVRVVRCENAQLYVKI